MKEVIAGIIIDNNKVLIAQRGVNEKLSVHDKIQWITISEIDKYDFAPAYIPLVKKLKEVF